MDHRIYSSPLEAFPYVNHPSHKNTAQAKKFGEILQDKQGDAKAVKLSKHAETRIKERGIDISHADWLKISEKMSEAKQKGVTDSLVMIDDATLLVSTKNHTVVTAMNQKEASSKVFTNINGAIVID